MPITVRNALKINNIPDLACFKTFTDLLKALPEFYSVEIPNDITNVVISSSEPDESQRDSLWIKTDTSGSFIGLFLYTGGAWNQIYPAPNEIFWVYGDSDDIPAGYELVDTGNANFTTAEIAHLQRMFYPGALIFDTWSPTVSANSPLIITPAAPNLAVYTKQNNRVDFQINVDGVLSGSAGPDLTFTTPFPFSSVDFGGPVSVFIGGVHETGYWTGTGSNTIVVRRAGAANYPNSGTVSFIFQGWFETSEAAPTDFSIFALTRTQF